jgi:NO-binding membrane sensor protein with MHYT domain
MPAAAEPRSDVVDRLERALERAKSGDIQGVQIAIMHADGMVSLLRAGTCNYAMVGILTAAASEMALALNDDD